MNIFLSLWKKVNQSFYPNNKVDSAIPAFDNPEWNKYKLYPSFRPRIKQTFCEWCNKYFVIEKIRSHLNTSEVFPLMGQVFENNPAHVTNAYRYRLKVSLTYHLYSVVSTLPASYVYQIRAYVPFLQNIMTLPIQ